ncbi:MAG: phosphate signaling complex protein PhoU [Holophagaceae bacterium]|nr:phosphate signaling complex protein PhoU [Holophagaceae bacterium]
MVRHFDSELQDLRDGLMAMAGQVEEMIDLSQAALSEGSTTKAEQVKALDRLVDEQELKLDQACIDLLALRSPIATDLRLIASSLKIIPEIERIGDHCCNIARRVPFTHPPILAGDALERLAGETRGMVREAVNAFVKGDAELAREVIADDDKVDALYVQIYKDLLRAMLADPLCIERASNLIIVIKNWERIADQATNIAEEVLFILEGVNVKHPYLHGRPGSGA